MRYINPDTFDILKKRFYSVYFSLFLLIAEFEEIVQKSKNFKKKQKIKKFYKENQKRNKKPKRKETFMLNW